MSDWAPVVGSLGMAVVVGTTVVLRGPVGKALADWIRGWSKNEADWMALEARKHGIAPESDAVRGDLADLQHRVAELEERLDFTERMLARSRTDKVLEPPAERK